MNELEQKQQFARDVYAIIRNKLFYDYDLDNDDLARYMLSQTMQESGWGQRQSGKYNYFGIKAKKGEPFSSILTTEYINGKPTKLQQNFRDYENLEDGLSEYIKLLMNVYNVGEHSSSIDDYATHVAKRYATDPEYVKKLKGVYEGRTFRNALKGYTVTPQKKKKLQLEYPPIFKPVNDLRKPEPIIIPYKKSGGNIIQKFKTKFKIEKLISNYR